MSLGWELVEFLCFKEDDMLFDLSFVYLLLPPWRLMDEHDRIYIYKLNLNNSC